MNSLMEHGHIWDMSGEHTSSFLCLFQVIGSDCVGAVWAGKPAIQTLLWQTGADICCEGTAAQTTQTQASIPPFWALVRHSCMPTRPGTHTVHTHAQVDTQNVIQYILMIRYILNITKPSGLADKLISNKSVRPVFKIVFWLWWCTISL